jgi:hypothetical protein
MAWTIDTALEDKLINNVIRNDKIGTYEFRVGVLNTTVTVEVYRLPNGDEAVYRRSHDIHTPGQLGPYRQSRPYWDNVPYALHQAIDSLTSYYRNAVNAGYTPDESWLVGRH